MTQHPDEPTLSLLQDDHRRYARWIRDLIEGPPTMTNEMVTLAADIVHHLRAVESTVLPELDKAGGAAEAAAGALRVYQARIEDCLNWLCAAERRHKVDHETLVKLGDAIVRHARLEDAVLRSWQAGEPVQADHLAVTEAAGVATGMLAGAALGSIAGPVGMVGGAIAGGAVAGAAVVASHVGIHHR